MLTRAAADGEEGQQPCTEISARRAWEAPAASPRAPSILVVDDDPDIRQVLVATLAGAGYRVQQAQDGEEALERLRAEGPADALLLDYLMPGRNGAEVHAELRQDPALAAMPVVLCSASGDGRRLGRRLAVAAFVEKPFDLTCLLDTMARVTGWRAAAPPPCASAER